MSLSQAWNEAYVQFPLTNWERNDLSDLARFVRRCRFGPGQVASVLDAGCGRGIRGLLALLMNRELNVPNTSYIGVDFSAAAIMSAADTAARWREEIQPQGELERAALGRLPPSPRPPLCAQAQFICQDLVEFLADCERAFDLTIDWMCLHEMPCDARQEYCHLLGGLTQKYLILNEFSSELSSVECLGYAVEGAPKYQLSQQDISSLFPNFEILATQSYSENLNPNQDITDGIIGAKCAYYLVRI